MDKKYITFYKKFILQTKTLNDRRIKVKFSKFYNLRLCLFFDIIIFNVTRKNKTTVKQI